MAASGVETSAHPDLVVPAPVTPRMAPDTPPAWPAGAQVGEQEDHWGPATEITPSLHDVPLVGVPAAESVPDEQPAWIQPEPRRSERKATLASVDVSSVEAIRDAYAAIQRGEGPPSHRAAEAEESAVSVAVVDARFSYPPSPAAAHLELTGTLDAFVSEAVRLRVEAALRASGGDPALAARELGIDERRMTALMDQYAL